MRRYWLFKTEPDAFGYDDLERRPGQTEPWDGVRNYQARNFLRDDCRVGDLVLLYHSRCEPPHVAGVAEIVRAGYPDVSALDPASKYHDPKASAANPIWFRVDVRAVQRLPRPVGLPELKADAALADMRVTQKGARLSIMPITRSEFDRVVALASAPALWRDRAAKPTPESCARCHHDAGQSSSRATRGPGPRS